MKGLVHDQRNWVCNTANAASLLWHMFQALPSPSSSVNWSGFYVVDIRKPDHLILGPFHGKVACQTIQIGKGVCGTVAETGETLLLDDVETFPGHIACDSNSKSEVVVPIRSQGKVGRRFSCTFREDIDLFDQVVGVIDIDCAEHAGFDQVDQTGLEALAQLLAESCDW